MRYITIITALLVFLSTGTKAGDVKALLSFSRFADPDKGAYLETYLNINSTGLDRVKGDGGSFHSEVLVEISIMKLGKQVYRDSYRVLSPSATDSAGTIPDFVDIQRIPLKNGMHQLTLSLSDALDSTATAATITQSIQIKHTDRTYLSDIQIVGGMRENSTPNMFTKVGYDLIPYASDFFPQNMNELIFYVESYSSTKDVRNKAKYLFDAYLVETETHLVTANLRKYFKKDAAPVFAVLHSFPLTNISSGNYTLIVELKNEKNELIDSKEFSFQRMGKPNANNSQDGINSANTQLSFAGKMGDKKKLEGYIKCLYPIADPREETLIEKQMNFNDLEMMQRFLYGFWAKRNPIDPESDWMKYKTAVDQVNVQYKTNVSKGCHTDRGRVYLQYGAPNSLSKNYYEPSSYPYEIWHYYHVERSNVPPQNNVKFVFARLEQGLNNFKLLHSTGSGELSNPRWKLELHQRSQIYRDVDQEDTFEYHGGKVTERFNNPY